VNHDNTNQGALFKNDKQGNERWPDYRGQINVNGTEYWISAWLKSSKAGQKYMSLSVQPKQAKDIKGAVAHKAPADFKDDLDIPF
jgi:uncharacterized protein (DUF736 family)